MDNVTIENVGGMRGVASEATLQSLVEAVRKSSGGGSSGDAAAARLQNLHSRAIKENTTAKQKNTTETASNTQKLLSFGKQLVKGDERISSFSDALFGSTTLVSKFAGYVDGLIDDFRSLSSVGATFNNSISDMVISSASAAMTIEGFTSLIRNNSTDLAYFGGTVTRGAKFLGEFSRDVRLGIGNDFFAMGMTIQDVNEGLVGFMATEAMRGRQALRNDSQTQESASNYIRQLNLLSKLTGKQAEALEQDIMALQTDAKMRNVLNQVEQTRGVAARQEAEAIYALQRNALPGFNDALLDMSDGIAQSDMARALESMAPGITQFQYRLSQGGMSLEEYQAGMSKFGSSISQYSSTIGGAAMDVYREQGGFVGNLAQLSDSVYQFNQLSLLDPAAARREQLRRDRITSTLGKFEQAVIAVRKAFFDAFINSSFATAIGNVGDSIMEVFDSNNVNSPFSRAGSGLSRLFNTIFGPTSFLTTSVQRLANYIRSGGLNTAFEYLTEKATAIGNWFKEAYEDGTFSNAVSWISEQITNIGNWFSEFTTSATDVGLWETIKNKFVEAANSLTTTFSTLWNDPQTQLKIERFFDDFTEKMAAMWEGSRAQEMMNKLTNFLQDSLTTLMETLNTGLLGLFIDDAALADRRRTSQDRRFIAGEMAPEEGRAYAADLRRQQELFETAQGWERRNMNPDVISRVNDLLANAPAYAKGTNGFQDFGKQRLAVLHGNEAVIPRNTPAGDMLAEFYKSQKGTVSAAPAATYNNTNQTDLNNKLDQLNSTMQTVASLLSESVNVQQRIKRGIGGMGTDLMRG